MKMPDLFANQSTNKFDTQFAILLSMLIAMPFAFQFPILFAFRCKYYSPKEFS